jgi:hypothetical protein
MSRSLEIEPPNQPKQPRSTDGASSNMQEQIRLRAFELYEARGRTDGHHEEDWYEAEKELLAPRVVNRAA